MSDASKFLLCAALIGTGATVLIDLWAILQRRLLGLQSLDYGLVGRWLAYLRRGRFHHASIAATPAVEGERALGWAAHYAIGVAFAAVLLAVWGLDWALEPDDRARAPCRRCQRACSLPCHATRHGRRRRRQPHAAAQRGAAPRDHDACNLWPWTVSHRLARQPLDPVTLQVTSLHFECEPSRLDKPSGLLFGN